MGQQMITPSPNTNICPILLFLEENNHTEQLHKTDTAQKFQITKLTTDCMVHSYAAERKVIRMSVLCSVINANYSSTWIVSLLICCLPFSKYINKAN